MTQNNLGNALQEQGIRTGGAEGRALLAEAVAAYRQALDVFESVKSNYYAKIVRNSLRKAEALLADHH